MAVVSLVCPMVGAVLLGPALAVLVAPLVVSLLAFLSLVLLVFFGWLCMLVSFNDFGLFDEPILVVVGWNIALFVELGNELFREHELHYFEEFIIAIFSGLVASRE